jgi:hypothetical protein
MESGRMGSVGSRVYTPLSIQTTCLRSEAYNKEQMASEYSLSQGFGSPYNALGRSPGFRRVSDTGTLLSAALIRPCHLQAVRL